MNFFIAIARNSAWGILSLFFSALLLACSLFFYMSLQLPDVDTLKDISLQEPLRIYTSDGKLITEYGEMRRIPVTLNQIPKQMIQAVLATEDRRYFEHPGVDVIGLARAAKELLLTGRKSQGASTITMQVARNFYLTREKTYSRKFNEILLAIKIDSKFSKEKILELYLNKIYLGQRSYGVAAAAQTYYGKTLDQLNLPEMAMIAGLPQAPSADNPITNPETAKDRRDHVLQRMYEQSYIDKKTYETAIAAPITAKYHGPQSQANAPYIAEMVRQAMVDEFGDKAYTEGFKVYTTITALLQHDANKAVREGLLAYDQRHGYRGSKVNLGATVPNDLTEWKDQLAQMPVVAKLLPAAVVNVNSDSMQALLDTGDKITINAAGFAWAAKSANAITKIGDVIRVEQAGNNSWRLAQVPQVEGALVSLNPNTGAILALTGGFSHQVSDYNRVIQAERQPGSNFKPFIYASALDKGFTLSSMINDAPIVVNDGSNQLWRPVNDNLTFNGPTRLRIGLIRSRNLVSIRLLRDIGVTYALDYVARFGFNPKKLPHALSLALGSGTVTPLQLVTGFSVFANGGYKIEPYFIDHIEDRNDKLIYTAHRPVVCEDEAACKGLTPAKQVISPQVAYLMTNVLQDVIQHGTGTDAKVLKRTDLSGKTGTTNQQNDAWFSGFNKDIVTTVWVGFDNPKSLNEFGRQAALPIWIDFMENALEGKPEHSMMQPDGIISARIDPNTGLLAHTGQQNSIFELFIKDNIPKEFSSSSSGAQQTSGGSNDSEDSAHLF